MKSALLFTLIIISLALQCCAAANATTAAVAWFTDADIAGSIRTAAPSDTQSTAPGTVDKGIVLNQTIALDDPLLQQKSGYIGFWIKPEWNGNDGLTHRILSIGDPERNGLLVEKSARGILRYVMASPEKVCASRAGVSGWKAGQWHHVVVGRLYKDNQPLGTPLWIDKVCVDGPIAAGNRFLDPDEMTNKQVLLGDTSSDAVPTRNRYRSKTTS